MTLETQQNVLAITEAYIAPVTVNTSTTYTTGQKIKLPDLSSLEVTVTSEKKEAKAGLKVADFAHVVPHVAGKSRLFLIGVPLVVVGNFGAFRGVGAHR